MFCKFNVFFLQIIKFNMLDMRTDPYEFSNHEVKERKTKKYLNKLTSSYT